MQNSQGWPNRKLSLFPSECNVANGEFEPVIPSDEAIYVTKSCHNPHDFNIITCKSANKERFLDEVGGLELNLPLKSITNDLPFYIPSTDLKTASFLVAQGYKDLLAVTTKDVMKRWFINSNGSYKEARDIEFKPLHEFSVFLKKAQLLLFLTGQDTGIEYLWRERDRYNLFQKIKEMNFLGVGGFNFSLFEGECAFAQALNQKRSLFSSFEFERNGISSIPHVYAITKFQIERWIKYFRANPQIKYFTVNCQVKKPVKYHLQDISSMNYILDNLPYLHILVQGLPFDLIERFGKHILNIHFIDTTPVNYARNYRKIDRRNGKKKLTNKSDLSPDKCVLHNIQQRILQVENVRNTTLSSLLAERNKDFK